MVFETKTDEELMALYQKGSQEAFQALYARHSAKVFGFISSRVRSSQQVSDIFQEVFMKLHRSKHLYDPNLPVLPWIFTITKNSITDEMRKTLLQKNQIPVDEVELTAPEISMTKELVPTEISKLPANQRLALEMRYLEEKTFDEIAKTLQTSESNIRQLVSRGLKRLKELLTEKGEPT